MQYTHTTQTPRSDAVDTIVGNIEQFTEDKSLDTIHAAMAYMSVAGVRRLLDVLHDREITQCRWLIGTDDAITQPGAIELCRDLPHSTVRLASFEEEYLRFHPKVLLMTSSLDADKALMMVGSANLTRHGLEGNAESVVFLHAESPTDVLDLISRWNDIWSIGRSLTTAELRRYARRYEKNKAVRKKLVRAPAAKKPSKPRKVKPVLGSDKAELDPSLANTCWIECGKNTAQGRELEIKAEQGLFFGLNPKGETPRHFGFRLSNGQTTQLRLKFQGNDMWRLQLTTAVPEVERGLRPRMANGKLGRSPWVAIIERTNKKGEFRLKFVKARSLKYRDLKKRSQAVGTVGRTSAREYGWL
jgi:HKD family nuclease